MAIACKAAELIQPGQVVILDGGITSVQLARQLPATLRATVVTHSPSVAVELVGHPLVEVVVLASAEKINAASAYVIADATTANTIIVERETPPSLTAPLAAMWIDIVYA